MSVPQILATAEVTCVSKLFKMKTKVQTSLWDLYLREYVYDHPAIATLLDYLVNECDRNLSSVNILHEYLESRRFYTYKRIVWMASYYAKATNNNYLLEIIDEVKYNVL